MAASNHYRFGTRLRVEGVGVVTVEDRIGYGSDLDLFGPSESFCRQFGRRLLRVEVAQ
jgi:3D (Asp-Asp-Asp) domain-containing protein